MNMTTKLPSPRKTRAEIHAQDADQPAETVENTEQINFTLLNLHPKKRGRGPKIKSKDEAANAERQRNFTAAKKAQNARRIWVPESLWQLGEKLGGLDKISPAFAVSQTEISRANERLLELQRRFESVQHASGIAHDKVAQLREEIDRLELRLARKWWQFWK